MDFKFDFQADNFRRFFDFKVAQMTNAQKENIPAELLAKIFRRDGKITTKYISFVQQLYILAQSQLSNVFVCIEDRDSGIGMEEYTKFKRKQNGRKSDAEQAEQYLAHGSMTLVNKDVAAYLTHLNAVSFSRAMNYILKLKNTKQPLLPDLETEFIFITNVLANYEGSKKKMIRRDQLSMPEWYVLLYLCDGEEKGGAAIYRYKYLDAINASRLQILKAFKKLIAMNYIQGFGKTKKATYKITYLGKSKVTEMFRKYILP